MTFKEILDNYKIPNVMGGEHKNVRTGFIGFDCPNCGDGSGKFHAAYNIVFGYCHCWKCGKLPLIKTLIELTYERYPVIKELLGDFRPQHLPEKTLRKGPIVLPTGLGKLLPYQRDYLRSRGFDIDELTNLWGLKGIGLHPKLSWRIFIPVQQRFKTVTYTTRSTRDDGLRYINCLPEHEAVPIKSTLFGMDYVGHSCLLTEGPFDAMRIGPGAVCGFGMSLTDIQISMLAKFPVRTICFDNEPDAQRKAEKICRDLSVFPGRTSNACLEYAKDPGSASEKELRKLRKLLR